MSTPDNDEDNIIRRVSRRELFGDEEFQDIKITKEAIKNAIRNNKKDKKIDEYLQNNPQVSSQPIDMNAVNAMANNWKTINELAKHRSVSMEEFGSILYSGSSSTNTSASGVASAISRIKEDAKSIGNISSRYESVDSDDDFMSGMGKISNNTSRIASQIGRVSGILDGVGDFLAAVTKPSEKESLPSNLNISYKSTELEAASKRDFEASVTDGSGRYIETYRSLGNDSMSNLFDIEIKRTANGEGSGKFLDNETLFKTRGKNISIALPKLQTQNISIMEETATIFTSQLEEENTAEFNLEHDNSLALLRQFINTYYNETALGNIISQQKDKCVEIIVTIYSAGEVSSNVSLLPKLIVKFNNVKFISVGSIQFGSSFGVTTTPIKFTYENMNVKVNNEQQQ